MKSPLLHFLLCLWLVLAGYVPATAAPLLVGVVVTPDNTSNLKSCDILRDSLNSLDYGPDKVRLFIQRPHADLFSWANSTRRAEAAGVSAIATIGMPLTRVALRETARLPVIYSGLISPLSSELDVLKTPSEKDLHRTTGMSADVPLATLVKTFTQLYGAGHIRALFHENDLDAPYQLRQLQQAAKVYNVAVDTHVLRNKDFSASLAELKGSTDVFFVSSALFSDQQLTDILKRFSTLQKPFLGCGNDLATQGALISIEVDRREQMENLAQYLVKTLEKVPVTDLPPLKPRHVDLIVNLKTASQFKLTVPFSALSAATRIIR